MASIEWKTTKNGKVTPENKTIKPFQILIKKSVGGLSYRLENKQKFIIKSSGTIEDLKEFAKSYYKYL